MFALLDLLNSANNHNSVIVHWSMCKAVLCRECLLIFTFRMKHLWLEAPRFLRTAVQVRMCSVWQVKHHICMMSSIFVLLLEQPQQSIKLYLFIYPHSTLFIIISNSECLLRLCAFCHWHLLQQPAVRSIHRCGSKTALPKALHFCAPSVLKRQIVGTLHSHHSPCSHEVGAEHGHCAGKWKHADSI